MSPVTSKSRYEVLKYKRNAPLLRARRMAELSIPSVQPPEGWNGTSLLPEPYQGIGARGVINLASRLMITLLPPGQKFFRLDVPPATLANAGENDTPPEISTMLVQTETLIQSEIDRVGWRQPTNLALQMLQITGNIAEFTHPDSRITVYRLDQFVVVRDPAQNVVEFILEQKLHPSVVPEAAREFMKADVSDPQAEVEIYTHVLRLDDKRYAVRQEVEGQTIPGSEGVRERNPFRIYRWNLVPGEDYGRGKIEDHVSDLQYLEMLTKSMVEGAAMASRNLTRIDPGATNARQIQNQWKDTPNGGMIVAEAGALEMFSFGNAQGLQIVQAEIARVTQELARAFLMSSGLQRDAERVTATELRMMAEELEGTLGGVYSMLSEEMQRGRLDSLIVNMQQAGSLPPFDKDMAEPTITTGLEALGREKDVIKVTQAFQAAPSLPPEALEFWDFEFLAKTYLNGLDLAGAVLPPEEVQQRRQERQAEAAALSAAGSPPQSQG